MILPGSTGGRSSCLTVVESVILPPGWLAVSWQDVRCKCDIKIGHEWDMENCGKYMGTIYGNME